MPRHGTGALCPARATCGAGRMGLANGAGRMGLANGAGRMGLTKTGATGAGVIGAEDGVLATLARADVARGAGFFRAGVVTGAAIGGGRGAAIYIRRGVGCGAIDGCPMTVRARFGVTFATTRLGASVDFAATCVSGGREWLRYSPVAPAATAAATSAATAPIAIGESFLRAGAEVAMLAGATIGSSSNRCMSVTSSFSRDSIGGDIASSQCTRVM